MDMIEIRRMVLKNTNELPPGFIRYDYLEQTMGTTPYIDTGVAGNDNTIQIDFFVEVLTKGSYASIMGNHDIEDKTCWRFIQGAANYNNRFNFTLNNRKSGSSPAVEITGLSTVVNKVIRIHMEYALGYAEYDGVKYYVNTAVTDDSAPSTLNIVIGRAGPTKGEGATLPSNRFHNYFRIWKQGQLVRNYIPCVRKSDNKAGFYDTVNHTFNPSIGSVDFIAGNRT